MPIISGKRTRLRALERTDLPRLVQWLNDPEVTAGLLAYLPYSMTHEEEWYQNMLKQPREEQPMAIEILRPDGCWQHIGNCGLHGINWKDRLGEAAILIGEKTYWSQGYGTDAMLLLLRFSFLNLNLNKVSLFVFANNPRAVRSYEKAGFVQEGRLRQDVYKNGEYLDVFVMSILRSEWQDRDI